MGLRGVAWVGVSLGWYFVRMFMVAMLSKPNAAGVETFQSVFYTVWPVLDPLLLLIALFIYMLLGSSID